MAERTIQIKVTGEEGGFTAMIDRIIDKNSQLNRHAIDAARSINVQFQSMQTVVSQLGGLLGVGFSVAGLVAFGREVVGVAGQIDDLAKRTGFSRQTLSAFKSTIEENGGSLEGFATAINKLQKSLGDMDGDGKKAAEALKAMGLNVGEITKMRAETAFEKIAEALATVEDQNQRVTIATRLFSRAGAEQIPVILELTDKFKDLKDKGVSDEAIKQLDKFGDALTRLKNQAIGLASEGLASLITMFDRLFKISDLEKARSEFAKTADGVKAMNEQIQRLREAPLDWRFGIFKSQDEREAQRQVEIARALEIRRSALDKLSDATKNLVALETKEGDKPAGGKVLDLNAEDNTKQLEKQVQAVERLKTQILQLQLTMAEAARAQGDMSVDVRSLALALVEQEREAALVVAANDKMRAALEPYINTLAKYKVAQIEATEKAKEWEQTQKDIKRAVEDAEITLKLLEDRQREEVQASAETLRVRRESISADEQIANLRADQLKASGLLMQADKLRLESQLANLKKLQELETDDNAKRIRDQQILNTQAQIERLGEVTMNVGQTITKSLGDAFEGVILGTSKLADIGKNLLSALGRDIAQFFTESIAKKLGFENILFSNLRGFGQQAQQALGPGGIGPSGGQNPLSNFNLGNFNLGGNGFGGIFSGLTDLLSVVGGRGGAPAGMAGPLMESGQFFSGTGGGLTGALTSIGSGLSNILPAGSTLGGILGGGFSGFGLGQMINGTTGGIAGAVGGAAGSIIGNSTAIGSMLGFTGSITSAIADMLGPMLGAMLGGMLASMVIPFLGALIAALMSLFSKPPDPSVTIKTAMTFFYDQVNQAFGEFTKTTLIKFEGTVSKQKIKAIIGQQQTILDNEAKRWTEVLNTFPVYVHEQMIGTLDSANDLLATFFGSKKYSEGGKRNIQQELADLKRIEGPRGVFASLRETIGLGFAGTLTMAGLTGAAESARAMFPKWLIGQSENMPGIMVPTGSAEETEKFVDALKKMIGFTTTLVALVPKVPQINPSEEYWNRYPDVAMNAPGDPLGYGRANPMGAWKHFREAGAAAGYQWNFGAGVGTFLTPGDIIDLNNKMQKVFETPGEGFAAAVDKFLEDVKPFTDFINKAIEEASNLFGKGLIAAMEAATESDAKLAFINSLNTGVKDVIFKGITEAFLASAQYTDLLAPIQTVIRQFTQQALATGETPDLAAFRSALLPGIEQISTRAETLAPLIGELQHLGFEIRDKLGLLPAPEPAQPAPTVPSNIIININGNVNDPDDAKSLAQRIEAMLSGQLSPT